MPVLRINATDSGLTLHGTPHPARLRLCAMAARPGPAIIMVHGYKYAPGSTRHCPHKKVFAKGDSGWPQGLGFDLGHQNEGLGIAFGWYARGTLRKVHNRAAQLGESLAVVIAMLRDHTPDRPVHIVAHSLGVEMALSALQHLPAGAVDRMVLMTGASYQKRAVKMLDSPAGRHVEVLNITSRENDLFDLAFEKIVPCEGAKDHAIGQGISAPNVVTVQLDCPDTLTRLAASGLRLAAPQKRVCHWSAYQRPGVMALYRQFLRAPSGALLPVLTDLQPQRSSPRWSRFVSPVAARLRGLKSPCPARPVA